MRVLLVEDDPMIAEAVSVALKDAAYAVDWVRDGEKAADALRYGEHQAVLLDLGLPGRGGLEVLAALREGGSSIPVIIITAREPVSASASRGWIRARTIISSSRLISMNCWRGSGR